MGFLGDLLELDFDVDFEDEGFVATSGLPKQVS